MLQDKGVYASECKAWSSDRNATLLSKTSSLIHSHDLITFSTSSTELSNPTLTTSCIIYLLHKKEALRAYVGMLEDKKYNKVQYVRKCELSCERIRFGECLSGEGLRKECLDCVEKVRIIICFGKKGLTNDHGMFRIMPPRRAPVARRAPSARTANNPARNASTTTDAPMSAAAINPLIEIPSRL
ncbi:hypothetical protein Tco_1019662 [Tanacetum coccineum]|uniref:Uncharacterized protein n=1 Tax=Tanacetum coccineum TaxID=301880 RepID=A0ABQ5G045_9ASTR